MSAPVLRRSPTHRGEVIATAVLTPRMRRVTVRAESMRGIEIRPAQDVELHLIEASGRRVKRRYTIRQARPQAGELDLDVLLHGDGPGSAWGASAQPGDEIDFQGPRGKLELRAAPAHLLIGDESALPAIAAIAEALPPGTATAVVEVRDAGDELPVAATVHWVHRQGGPPGTPDVLLPTVTALGITRGLHAYLMGETRSMVRLRGHLEDRGVDHDAIFVKGYWNIGRPDRIADGAPGSRPIARPWGGRDTDRRRIAGTVDGTASGFIGGLAGVPTRSTAVLIEGPAGIGKTHRWNEAVAAVIASGWRLLVARPGEAEARLGGTGLIDLLSTVSDDEIAQLPGPQSRALLAALLRDEVDADPDPRIVSVALTSLVKQLAAAGPVVIAIDDVQWLDAHTATLLGYVVRRCPDAGVGFVLTQRTPADTVSPAAELDEQRMLTRIEVAPLDTTAIAGLLRSRLNLRLPGSLLTRAATTSGGNPFYAVELARVWSGAADALLDSLPVPESLHALVGTRIAALPDATRATLAAVSTLGRATVADLRALDLADDIAPAERAGLIVVEQGAVRFTHPLLAAAVYDDLTGTERAALHLRVAGIVADVEQRARHLALATKAEGPNAEVAALLDEAVRRAERRADVSAAVEVASMAVRSSPPDDEHTADRRFALGRLLFKSGDTDGARTELEALDDSATPRRIRIRALTMLCELAFAAISLEAAQAYGQAAINAAEPGADDDLLADAYIHLANGTDDIALAEKALELVHSAPSPNPATHATALALVAGQRFFSGLGLDRDAFEHALALEEEAQVGVAESMAGYYLAVLSYSDETDAAMALCDRQEQRCADEGAESQQGFTLMWRSHLLLKSGRLAEAAETIKRHAAASEQTGQVFNARYARYNEGRLALLRGDLATARRVGEELIASGIPAIELIGLRVAGEAAVYDGDLEVAVRHLQRVEELGAGGRDDPSALTHLAPLVEALVAMGRAEDAVAPLDHLSKQAEATDRRSALSLSVRCRAVIATAAGDEDAAIAAFDDSIALYDGMPAVAARTLLLKGQALRRFRRKAQAKQTLTEARAAFVALDAPGWVERVEQELSRVGLRPPAPSELTPTEQRVVELTATGMSAKDVAGVLFVSPRTVEAHLGRAYRKLGLRSRAELVARYATGGRVGA